MATHYSVKNTVGYTCAWKCDSCGKINVKRFERKQEQGYRTTTKYSSEKRMQDAGRFRADAEEKFRNEMDKFEEDVNSGTKLSELNIVGKCSECGNMQRWKFNKFEGEILPYSTMVIVIILVMIICYAILHLPLEACLVIGIFGGGLFGAYCGGCIMSAFDKTRIKRLNSIPEPEARPIIIGRRTKEKLARNDEVLLKDARIHEWIIRTTGKDTQAKTY